MVGVDRVSELEQVEDSASQQPIIPLSIFLDRNVSVLEALCEYLKEEYNLSFAAIGRLANRDERNIWTAYTRAKEKRKHRMPTTNFDVTFPLSAVRDRSLSIFESIIVYLRDKKGISNNNLAAACNRSAKTISTVYTRAKKK